MHLAVSGATLALLASVFSAAPPVDHAANARAVLIRHCASCHGEQAKPKGGLGHISDLQRLLDRGQVLPGQPSRSPLFQRVLDGEMPPPSKTNTFTALDRETLRQWIAAGAPTPNANPRRLSESELYQLLRADLESFPPRQRRFVRYLTITHLATRPAERATIRHALAKLLNSLSWHPRLVVPQSLAGGLMYRIDLRDYRWTARQWDRLAARYPYLRDEPTDLARNTGSDRPVLRADWFIATASRPPAYHDLLGLPTTDRALERLVQVDVPGNIDDQSTIRAGFNGSGVARANRIIERHDAAHGALWRSYDFSDNTGRQNLFEFPLGPAPGPAGFKHAGGEIIFHLPNGLQGYLLVDADGRRVDKAPGEIVSDPKRPDRLVENGLSCMGCHVTGILPKDDQVRAHVRKNPKAFTADQQDEILGLYAPAKKMAALVKEDNERFARALGRLGVPSGEPEPVLAVVLRYEDIVDLRRAADELALSPEELTTHLRRVPELARTLGSLLARGGVQRQVFEDSFARLAQELPQRSGGNASGEIRAHERTVTALAWEARGRRFASADAGGEVRVHELASKRSISLVEHKGEVRALAFSTDGRQLLSAGSDRVIVLWDLTVNKRLKRLVGHTDRIRAVAFGPNGRWAVSAGEDRTIRLWDLAEGKERRAFTGHTGTITALAISDDGKRILSGSTDRTARLWHAETGKQLGRLDHTGEVLAVAFSPRGDQLLSGASDRSMTLFHADRPTPVRRLTEQPGPVVAVGFSRNERSLLSVTIARESSGEVHVHHLSTGRPLHRVRTGAIQLAALNRQGSVLVGKDREVRIMTTGARTNEPRTK